MSDKIRPEVHKARQHAFNGAWRGLKSQGFERSLSQGGAVSLQDGRGRHCAIGWLVPQERQPKVGICLWNVDDIHPLARPAFGDGSAFTVDLFAAHDEGLTPTDMERRLRALATKYDLTVPDGD